MLTKLFRDPFALAIVAAVCGASVAVAAKIALEVFPPFILIFIRFLCATLFLLPFMVSRGSLTLIAVRKFALVGIVGALNPILFFVALQYTSASVSPLIYASVPLMTALYFYVAAGEKIEKKQSFGIVMGFIGVLVVMALPLVEQGPVHSTVGGNFLIFMAAIAFMVYGILSKVSQKDTNASPLELTFYFCLMSLLISVPFSLSEIFSDSFAAAVGLRHVIAAISTGIIGTGIFYLAYQYALTFGSATSAALFMYLQPIATVLLAWVFLGEQLTPIFIVGGVLAVIGARLASKDS